MFRDFLPRLASGAVLLVLSAGYVSAQSGPANASAVKPSEEVYKNIQVLKGTPADELIPAMQFITYSLGVECSYCHVEGALEKDDKKTKLAARKMMQMMSAINRDNFDAKQKVTCNSCHRGATQPVAIPTITENPMPPMFGMEHQENATAAGPSPEPILSKYVDAVGGAPAFGKLNSRTLQGSVTVMGRSLPFEILSKPGNKQVTLIHLPNGDGITAYNGGTGWTSAPNRPSHDIPADEIASARVETDLRLPIDLKTMFSDWKVEAAEKIGDRGVYVLSGSNSGEVAAKFYFDQDSGLLVRILRYTRTPLGLNPTQIDYADYRQQDGIKIPFSQTVARPNSRFVFQVEEGKINVPVDDARFVRPAMPMPPAKPPAQ